MTKNLSAKGSIATLIMSSSDLWSPDESADDLHSFHFYI